MKEWWCQVSLTTPRITCDADEDCSGEEVYLSSDEGLYCDEEASCE